MTVALRLKRAQLSCNDHILRPELEHREPYLPQSNQSINTPHASILYCPAYMILACLGCSYVADAPKLETPSWPCMSIFNSSHPWPGLVHIF